MGRRVRKDIPVIADVIAANPILLEGESLFVNNNGVLEHWVGLDGIWSDGTISGTAFNSLPVSQKINATGAGGVANVYTSKATLFAGQGTQVTNGIYRLTTTNPDQDIWLEYLGTTNGDETDYKGWGTVEESISVKLDTTGTGVKSTIECTTKDKTITKVSIQSVVAASGGDAEFDIQVDNVSIFSSKPTIYAGNTLATSGVIVNDAWNIGSILTIHLNSINNITEPTVSITIEYDAFLDSVELPDLNRPSSITLTPGIAEMTIAFTPDTNATSHAILFHSGDSNWTALPGYNGTDTSAILHTLLSEGQQYYYAITSSATGFNTSASATASETTLSGGFSLSSLSPIGQYDLSVDASVTTVGSNVSQLDNQLGSMGNFVQATDANRFTYDDANDLMSSSSSGHLMTLNVAALNLNNNTNTIEIYGVVSFLSLARQTIFSFYSATNSNYTATFSVDSSTAFRLFKGDGAAYDTGVSGAVTALATGTKYIFKLVSNSSGLSIDVGGRTYSLSSTKADDIVTMIMGSDGIPLTTSYYGLRGNLYEVILFDHVQSAQEESDIRAYLTAKWSV